MWLWSCPVAFVCHSLSRLLESGDTTADNPDLKFLQSQLDRLDPARKSLSFIGFQSTDAIARTKVIEDFFKEHFASLQSRITIEHVMKGPVNDRKMKSVSIIEFHNKAERDSMCKTFKDSRPRSYLCTLLHASRPTPGPRGQRAPRWTLHPPQQAGRPRRRRSRADRSAFGSPRRPRSVGTAGRTDDEARRAVVVGKPSET